MRRNRSIVKCFLAEVYIYTLTSRFSNLLYFFANPTPIMTYLKKCSHTIYMFSIRLRARRDEAYHSPLIDYMKVTHSSAANLSVRDQGIYQRTDSTTLAAEISLPPQRSIIIGFEGKSRPPKKTGYLKGTCQRSSQRQGPQRAYIYRYMRGAASYLFVHCN